MATLHHDAAPRCSGCGRSCSECPTSGRCRGPYEPPRYCTECGRRLRVVITPVGWSAACRVHGPLPRGGGPQ